MSHYFSKIVDYSFDEAVAKLITELEVEGFGILTETDIKARLKNKFNIDFRRYKILEAWNPPFAYETLRAGNIFGTTLPCNVIVQEIPDGQVKVAAIDPLASIHAVENPKLKKLAAKIGKKLRTVIDRA